MNQLALFLVNFFRHISMYYLIFWGKWRLEIHLSVLVNMKSLFINIYKALIEYIEAAYNEREEDWFISKNKLLVVSLVKIEHLQGSSIETCTNWLFLDEVTFIIFYVSNFDLPRCHQIGLWYTIHLQTPFKKGESLKETSLHAYWLGFCIIFCPFWVVVWIWVLVD